MTLIDLTTVDLQVPIQVQQATALSIQIIAGTWGTASVAAYKSNDGITLGPPVAEFTSSDLLFEMYAPGSSYIILTVKTADGAASDNAEVFVTQSETDQQPVLPTNNSEQLGQIRPADTTPATLVSPPVVSSVVRSIQITNTSGADATFRIFHDDDGTTADETTALYWDTPIAAGESLTVYDLTGDGWLVKVGGSIKARSSVASALTFTAYGKANATPGVTVEE